MRSLPAARRMEFRIGINLGDVMVEGDQIYGEGVNIAARLEALAEAGGICLSGTVHEQVKHKLALHYEDLGEQAVKNIAEPCGSGGWMEMTKSSRQRTRQVRGQEAGAQVKNRRGAPPTGTGWWRRWRPIARYRNICHCRYHSLSSPQPQSQSLAPSPSRCPTNPPSSCCRLST